MRRSGVDAARHRQAMAERRFRGHRIRDGLGELGDLDAPQKNRSRRENADTADVERSVEDGAYPNSSRGNTIEAQARPSLSSSGSTGDAETPAVYSTVFGQGWDEWMEVKRVLFDMTTTAAAKRSALAAMQIWRHRARKERELPTYVESTEMLLDAMLQDEEDRVEEGALRMAYGAAISRVVHIMTGSFASGSADTYRKRAHEIGFPAEAVEVRQRVAHGALPLLSELRWVCGLALQFLFIQYWMEQERQIYLMQASAPREDPCLTTTATAARSQAPRPTAFKKRKTVPSTAMEVSSAKTSAPSVSVSEMKALLRDLESEEEDVATHLNSVVNRGATELHRELSNTPSGDAQPTRVNSKRTAPAAATAGGWFIS